MTLEFAPGVVHRLSKRGLVAANADGGTVLLEHPRAHALPDLLARRPTAEQLHEVLGPPLQAEAIPDLVAAGILADTSSPRICRRDRDVMLSRSGLLFRGIAAPSRWLDTYLVPVLTGRAGGIVLVAVALAGAVSLAPGIPGSGPAHGNPAAAALLLVALGLLTGAAHELAHAVALTHYGRTPGRAGLGLYWGSLSFFVDSSPALTLPRRQRVTQALAGLATDAVTTGGLALLARAPVGAFWAGLLWQRALLNLIAMGVNAAPVLEVDGHWALADLLDEPELARRARAALAGVLHGRAGNTETRLAAYGAVSLLAGVGLLVASTLAMWTVLHRLVGALFTGSIGDLLVGVYLVAPTLIAVVLSLLGLILQSTTLETSQ